VAATKRLSRDARAASFGVARVEARRDESNSRLHANLGASGEVKEFTIIPKLFAALRLAQGRSWKKWLILKPVCFHLIPIRLKVVLVCGRNPRAL
jgi:hypothetical protein